MSKQKYNGLKKLGTAKGIIITLIILGLISFFINSNIIGMGKLYEITDGVGILDMKFSYTADEAYSLFDALGADGRSFCLTRISPLDMIYPAAYTMFFIALLAFIIKKIFPKNNKMMVLSLIPIVGGLFDYLENIMVIIMLNNYPTLLTGIVHTANVFTIIKWTSFPVTISLIVIGLVILLIRRNKKQPLDD